MLAQFVCSYGKSCLQIVSLNDLLLPLLWLSGLLSRWAGRQQEHSPVLELIVTNCLKRAVFTGNTKTWPWIALCAQDTNMWGCSATQLRSVESICGCASLKEVVVGRFHL